MVADAQSPFYVRKIADQFLWVDDLMWMDQETLAYTGHPEGELGPKPYIINLKSGLQTRIRTDRDGGLYTWAPDGTALAYAADTATSNVVYVQDRSSGRGAPVWELTHALIQDVAWSPNSQWLLINVIEELPPTTTYTVNAYTETIWVISRDGTFAKRVTPLMPGEPDP
jgi:Tol biopolymer transport system component